MFQALQRQKFQSTAIAQKNAEGNIILTNSALEKIRKSLWNFLRKL
jgi:hypothetical protein